MSSGGKISSKPASPAGKVHKAGGRLPEMPASWWNLQPQLYDDNSTTRWVDAEIFDKNARTRPGSDRSMEFEVHSQADSYFLPSRGYFEVQIDVTNGSADVAGDMDAVDKAAMLAGIPLAGVLDSCSYYIKGHEIERIEHANVGSLIHYLTKFPQTRQNKELLFTPSTGSAQNEPLDPSHLFPSVSGGDKYNFAFNQRLVEEIKKRTHAGTTLTYVFRVPLAALFPFCRQNRMVFTGQMHRIRLERLNNDSLLAGYASAGQVNYSIEYIALRMPMLHADPYVKQLHRERYLNKKLELAWESMQVEQQEFTSGNNLNWRIANASGNLNSVVLLARTKAAIDATTTDPLATTTNLTHARLRFNGDSVPAEYDYRINKKRDQLRVYEHYLRHAGGLELSDSDVPITFDQFKQAYQLIVFNIRDTTERSSKSFTQLTTLDLNATFSTANPMNLTAVLFSDRFMQMEWSDTIEAPIVSGVDGDN